MYGDFTILDEYKDDESLFCYWRRSDDSDEQQQQQVLVVLNFTEKDVKWKVPTVPVGATDVGLNPSNSSLSNSNLKEEESGIFELLVSNYDYDYGREETRVRSGEGLELGGYEGRVYLFKT